VPSPSPDPNIQFWFNNLKSLQSASNNTTLMAMNLLQFANSNIVAYLKSSKQQSTFLTSSAALTGYSNVAPADLAGFKTFEGLLDQKWNYLPTALASALQPFADASVQGGAGADFWNATVAQAFPGGSTAKPWQNALGCLTASMPPECFTAGFQAQINAIVDKGGSKVSDLLPQIAVLG
jgi:hypothetical protein